MRRLPTTLLLTALIVLSFALDTEAQTPTTTVQDASGNTVFQTFAQGQLLVPGPYNTGATIPASGAGTRLMWWPEKAAFRAGRVFDNSDVIGGVNGSQFWDASNVGTYSVALGRNTRATGQAATAMGDGTTASAEQATAMGVQTTASGRASMAVGDNATAEGVFAVATGSNTTASGDNAVAMGDGTTASGRASTAMGTQGEASGIRSTTMGRDTDAATDNSLSIGKYNSANTSADGTLFVVGNGDNNTSRSDALVLDDQGNLTVSSQGTFSDRRLKTGIKPLSSGIVKKLNALRPVRYEFKNQETHPSGEQIGLVAQDVRKEFPQLVNKGSDGMLSLAYPKLTAVLVKGLQEQQAKLEEKQVQIDSLTQRVRQVETLKKRLTALEAKVSSGEPAVAGLGGSSAGLLLAFLTGGLLGAGLLWRRRGA